MMSVIPGQVSSLVVLAIAALMAASWSCSSGAELNDLVESSRHHLPYDSIQGDPRESNWDEAALSEEKRARSQSWRIPPSDWAVNKRYMRFGRSSTDDLEDVDVAAYPNEDEKRYMRFGKRYMRFGRRVGPSHGRDLF